MRVKTHRHVTHSVDYEDQELELDFAPCGDDILIERVGDKLVVAYLVQDSDPCNPMEDFDAQGNFYTMPSRYGGGSITDDASEIYSALGVSGYGEVDIDDVFYCDPYIDWKGVQQKAHSLRDIAAREFLDKFGQDVDLISQALEGLGLELAEGETLDQAFQTHKNEIWGDLEDSNGVFCEEVEGRAIEMYPEYWQKIAGPFTVPCNYCSNNHGPGTTSLSTTTWDGDPDDLPNAIWVADKNAIDNITPYPAGVGMKQVTPYPDAAYGVFKEDVEVFRGTWEECKLHIKFSFPAPNEEDLRRAAVKYADGLCKEYASWCNGEVFGCVTQVFDLTDDGEWEDNGESDSCWGHIGYEYAQETLKSEYFEGVIKNLKETK